MRGIHALPFAGLARRMLAASMGGRAGRRIVAGWRGNLVDGN
jgi:hypothetical protein